MSFEPLDFQARDLLFVYANRESIITVSDILGVSPIAMAASIGAETQNIFKGPTSFPGGIINLAANIWLDKLKAFLETNSMNLYSFKY